MTPDSNIKGADYYQRLITVLLAVLAFLFALLITVYWSAVLEPGLRVRARVTARSVVTSHLVPYTRLLENDSETALGAAEIYLGKVLVLKDGESGVPFVSYLELHVEGQSPEQIHVLGPPPAKIRESYLKTEDIPLFSDQTRELLAVVTWAVNPVYVARFIHPVKVTFFAGVGGSMVLFALAWWITVILLARVRRAEKNIEQKKAQLIHAGRLTAMGEMATGIAHELNQPLAIIRIASDGLTDWFDKQDVDCAMEKKAAETIALQVERARGIIDHMRSFSRTDTRGVRQISLAEPITHAVSFFREQFKHHGIQLMVDLPDDPVHVYTDPDKFEQIVVNLLSNARFAVDNGPNTDKRIHISLKPDTEKSRMVFEVSDNGIGMDRREKERCLEPFYTTKPVGDGTGLGLSIVHTLAKESGMVLDIESEKGRGCIFRLFMPENTALEK